MKFCSISSGSSGNCFFVGSDRTNILIDIGISKKSLLNAINMINVKPNLISGILITHEHLDHYKGASVVCKSLDIPLYLNELTFKNIEDKLKGVERINIIDNKEFSIGDLDIRTFKLPHDAVDPIGYSILDGTKKLSIATDIGYMSKDVFDNIKDSDVILIESNYNEDMLRLSNYPYFLKERILSDHGHLSNEECALTIVKLAEIYYKRVILGHLSITSNFPELAYKTSEKIILNHGMKIGKDLKLTIAHRSLPSNYMRF